MKLFAAPLASALVLLAGSATVDPLSARNMQPGSANGGNGGGVPATATATEVTDHPPSTAVSTRRCGAGPRR